jgi:DNA-binding NarL/FixJ family response regulator
MPGDMIRVVLADDHMVVRIGLKAVLRAAQDIEVVGEATNGHEAVALAERLCPDVLVTDLSMADTDGATATKEIVARGLPTRVLVLTMYAEEEYLIPLIQAGAAGFLMKNAAERELVDAVRTIAHGDVYIRPAAARILARGIVAKQHDPSHTAREQFDKLTPREQAVLRLTAQGYSAPEVGEKLCISPKTVDTYKQRIQEKLGLSHRSEYVQFALQLNLLAPT